jgi:hypothetical protein
MCFGTCLTYLKIKIFLLLPGLYLLTGFSQQRFTTIKISADGDMAEYPKTIDYVIRKFRQAEIVIPGHGQIGGPELLQHTRDLLHK